MSREALLRRDAATLRLLLRSWQPVARRLTDELDALLRRLEGKEVTASQIRRMARYRALLEQVDALTASYARGVEPLIVASQRAAVELALVDAGTAIGTSFTRLPVEAVNDLIGRTAAGPLSDLLATFGPDAARQAGEVLTAGVAQGLNPRQIAAAFRQATNASAVRAMRVARTETLRSYRSASLASYQANRDILAGWIWTAAVSQAGRRTCPICLLMHNTVHPLDEPFASHISCRCSPRPWLKDAERPQQTGVDLFRAMPADEQRAILGPGKYALYAAGRLDLASIPVRTSGVFGPGLRMRTVKELRA